MHIALRPAGFIILAFLSIVNISHAQIQPTQDQINKFQQKIATSMIESPPGSGNFVSKITLSIGDGDIIDAQCTILFPKSSWDLASIVADPTKTKLQQYQDVLNNTSSKIFAVFYLLIADPAVQATEINVNGLWRPFVGSEVHLQGRGIDIGYIRSLNGSGVIFNVDPEQTESAFGAIVRKSLTSSYPLINQYLCPWYMCDLPNDCTVNNGQTKNEKTHKNHLHLTLNP